MPAGYRPCPKCNQSCHIKKVICPSCSYDFAANRKPKEEKTPVVKKNTPKPTSNTEAVKGITRGFVRVYTPAGNCPVKLEDDTPESIANWKLEVKQIGLSNQKIYTEEALDYWLSCLLPAKAV